METLKVGQNLRGKNSMNIYFPHWKDFNSQEAESVKIEITESDLISSLSGIGFNYCNSEDSDENTL